MRVDRPPTVGERRPETEVARVDARPVSHLRQGDRRDDVHRRVPRRVNQSLDFDEFAVPLDSARAFCHAREPAAHGVLIDVRIIEGIEDVPRDIGRRARLRLSVEDVRKHGVHAPGRRGCDED